MALLLSACSKDSDLVPAPVNVDSSTLEHGMIVLGDQLDDPYSVDNMTKALLSLYPTKADAVRLEATDLYVRLLPRDDADVEALVQMGVQMLDHPLDYQIVREGDYYQDPQIPDGNITWQYAVVPTDFKAPDGIRCELLHECYLAEPENVTKAGLDWADWDAVERESFKLTGNGDMLLPETKAREQYHPCGRITVVDPDYAGGPTGLKGVMVSCNVFVKFARTFTDDDGNYSMPKSFAADPRYRLVFTNKKGFSIGMSLILLRGSISTLGKNPASGCSVEIQPDSGDLLYRRAAINNAAYDYFEQCKTPSHKIALPPSSLRIWSFGIFDGSAALMLQQGAIIDNDLISAFVGEYMPIVRMFLPDIVLGLREADRYSDIYRSTVHELAHASHYMQVGNAYWDTYAEFIVKSFVTSRGITYGTGAEENAGYCEVGEMWAYYVENVLYRERYPDWSKIYGTSYWFSPQILLYLDERGLNRYEISAALTSDVISRESLRLRLLSLYPECKSIISQAFSRYL